MGDVSLAEDPDLLAAEHARQAMLPARAAVESLDELRGPRHGIVELPLHLDWSTTNSYDLTDTMRTRTMYSTVLREAKDPEDLRALLNADVLRRSWGDLRLPAAVRAAWESAHPELASKG